MKNAKLFEQAEGQRATIRSSQASIDLLHERRLLIDVRASFPV
jgi:hypothetical protein